ncbi:MAG TPA: rhodanese-like domain-containing protein, partial [Burkholderiaceae bacterium]
LRADPVLLDAWLARGDQAALEAAITRAGIDLSRQVIVYGDAGDARAQALVKSLASLTRGRVDWFVGGEAEWWQSGRPVQASGAQRHPVPQVLLASSKAAGRMAGASLRHVQGVIPAGVLLAGN